MFVFHNLNIFLYFHTKQRISLFPKVRTIKLKVDGMVSSLLFLKSNVSNPGIPRSGMEVNLFPSSTNVSLKLWKDDMI